MRILFISRAYPPVFGGIEMQNFGIGQALSKITETKIIANKKGKKFLPIFIPYAIFKALFLIRNYDAVLLGDGVLSFVGYKLKFFTKKPVICIVHGLDLTFKSWIYQKFWVGYFLKKMDKLIAVGNETVKVGVEKGISEDKFVFIPNGLDVSEICGNYERKDLEEVLGINLNDKKVIFRGGRFVRHKGLTWFIQNVMPKLPENFLLVAAGGMIAAKTAGDKNDYQNAEKAIKELNLEKRVWLLGNLERSKMKILFNTCDLYISPNIKVAGSMEGFGITAIEAGACERVVLASELEGLKDAIKDGENGFLLEAENEDVWVEKIKEVLNDDAFRQDFGERARRFVEENYSWEKISGKYLDEINKLVAG